MSSPTFNKAIGGITPLGVITCTPGTPIQVTANLNISDQWFSLTCRHIGFSVAAAPSGEVYVNYGKFAGKGKQTAIFIESSQQQSLPVASIATEGLIDATQWYLDASAGCVVAVYLLDASS